mmetsp:Transcript_24335/g.51348  ORF Transcript_24335/g.51348 Transcript_24335/m.51348 type:complete len:261 (+) Transcript_24335:663-1445(+)
MPVVGIGEIGAGIVGEESEVDASTFVGAVGPHVILNLIVVISITVVVVVVVVPIIVIVQIELPLLALHIPLRFKPLIPLPALLFLFVRIPINTILILPTPMVAIVLAILTIEIISFIIRFLAIAILPHVSLAFPIPLPPLSFDICLGKRLQVDDVLSVIGIAPTAQPSFACIGRTQTEMRKVDGFETNIVIAIGVGVEGGVVAASLEFEGVVGYPGVVWLVVVVVVLFEETRLREERSAQVRGGGDGGGQDFGCGGGCWE